MFYLNTLFMDWKVEHDRHWNLLTLLTVNTDFLRMSSSRPWISWRVKQVYM